jgi:ornithine cyclodeaminase
VTDAHIAAEIGEIFSGRVAGRTSHDEITVYKSLGHAVQDIAALAYAYRKRIATSAPGATASIS